MGDIEIKDAQGNVQLAATIPAGTFRDAFAGSETTLDQALWGAIRNRTTAAGFTNFEKFVELMFCKCLSSSDPNTDPDLVRAHRHLAGLEAARFDGAFYLGSEAYNLLKAAAEVFLALQCGIKIRVPPADDGKRGDKTDEIPGEVGRGGTAETYEGLEAQLSCFLTGGSRVYLQTILNKLGKAKSPMCEGLLRPVEISLTQNRKQEIDGHPCMLELIWSYWHEEGMLVQALNAICLRFQNKRGPRVPDPLAHLRLDPLRPLNNLLWGYIQDEHNRLTVARRASEYDHEYGLRLQGRAVADLQTVDSRSKFIEAFHNLLCVTNRFYKEADHTMVRPDAFPVFNALKELHLILAQGAHNQFGDLPWAARVEMLIQKWLLARPEIREFLGGVPMVPYKENWMAHADAMKTLQGWSDVSVTHYRDLGVLGEQILLSVRHAAWSSDEVSPANAHNWALYWRSEIKSYIHAYRAVTGVDLTADITDPHAAGNRYEQPSTHLARRLQAQLSGASGQSGLTQATRPSPHGAPMPMAAVSRNGQAPSPRKRA